MEILIPSSFPLLRSKHVELPWMVPSRLSHGTVGQDRTGHWGLWVHISGGGGNVEPPSIPSPDLVSCPAPPRTCEKGGSGVLNNFSCHSSPIREFESDCRTSLSMRSSMPAVRCMCTGNAIITFFTPFDPAPCDKKCRSEHQILFPLFGGGVWGRE